MKRNSILFFILVCCLMVITVRADEKADFDKGLKLFKAEKYDEALKVVDDAILKYGETDKWLEGKYRILLKLNRLDEAMEVAIKRDSISKKKSPWSSYDIADLNRKLKKDKQSLDWLEKAVDRGFYDYHHLETNWNFEGLQEKRRLDTIVKRIKQKVGIGSPPKNFTAKTLKGMDINLSDYRGKVVLLDFWATWCSPCVKEIPALKKHYAEYKDKGFEIIGINLDNDKDKLTNFITKENLQWPMVFSSKGWNDDTARLYGVNSIPSTWLIGKKGNLRYLGFRGEELGKAIKKLLQEK